MPVCVTSSCAMSICAMSSCVMSVCAMSICLIFICVMSSFEMPICVISARVMSSFVTSIFVMLSCVMSVCVMSICVMSICVHSYPERNLHTASCKSRMAGQHQHKFFASPIGTATPSAIYTQQAAKPACQEDINTKFAHARKTSTQNLRTPGRHQHKIFASPHSTATPSAIRNCTHSKRPNPPARKTSTQNFRISA